MKTKDKLFKIDSLADFIYLELTSAERTKRLNNLNWLRTEISYTEPRTLFQIPQKQQKDFLDYTNIQNIGNTYTYILNHRKTKITERAICDIHAKLCHRTQISDGGRYRECGKKLDFLLGDTPYTYYTAPEYRLIPSIMGNIEYYLENDTQDTPFFKAINIHAELVKLQPFNDFNKRTARLIMNWILIQNKYTPIVFNHREDKTQYIKAIYAYIADDKKSYNQYMMSHMIATQTEILKLLQKSRI